MGKALRILGMAAAYILLLTSALKGQCLQFPVSVDERLEHSEWVFEGTVGASESFWGPDHRLIYTAHRVQIHRLWKAPTQQPPAELWVLTLGGRVGDTIMKATPALELAPGEMGVFFSGTPQIDLTQRAGLTLVQPYADGQGFARYDRQRETANDLFHTYGIETELVPMLVRKIGHMAQWVSKPPVVLLPIDQVMATPTISNFSPSSLNAGIGNLLTINGNNFGATAGTVEFGDADQAPGNFIRTAAHNIISWSNTQIQVQVPYRAGTGKIIVENAAVERSAQSAATLTVVYNIINTVDNNADFRLKLTNRDSTGGFVFVPNTAFRSNGPAFAAFERALTEWRCKTGVNFEISNLSTNTTCENGSDGINLVTFAGGACPLGAGKLGVCFSSFVTCPQTGDWLIVNLDLLFIPTAPQNGWNFGPGAPAGNQFDFQSVATHELGHAHQLGHVIDPSIVMNFAFGAGDNVRTLNAASDIAGGLDVLTNSSTSPGCGLAPMTGIPVGECAYNKPRIQIQTRLLPAAESTVSSSGCRGFRDYPVNLTISAAPATAVDVNLNVINGTAFGPADLELIPAVVTFPAGSAAPRSFMVRIWDDSAIESTETATIEAVTGSSAAFVSSNFKLIVTIQDNDDIPGLLLRENFEPGSPRLGEWLVNAVNASMPNIFAVSTNSPISGIGSLHISNNSSAYQYTTNDPLQTLSFARTPELNAVGVANLSVSFDFRVAGQKSGANNMDYGVLGYWVGSVPGNVSFFVGNALTPTVPTPFVNQPTVTRYSSPVFPAAANESQFRVAFIWKNDATGGTQPPFMIDNVEVTGGVNIQSGISNRNLYLGPLATVYYLSPGGNLMLKIENLSTHDYGCTTVDIDRIGNGAVLFQNPASTGFVTRKTFVVTPANPNPTGTYRITLYYTEAEIAGWEAATGRSRAELSILKSPSAISTNNPVDAVYGVNPTFDFAYGGHALTAEFSTGFSGFGGALSTVDGPLPITDFVLSGQRTREGHILTWRDSEAETGQTYLLERQNPEQPWQSLEESTAFTYFDAVPKAGWNRYRVQTTDFTGQLRYSNEIELFETDAPEAAPNVFRVYPNPASDVLTLESGDSELLAIRVYDALGRRVMNENLSRVSLYALDVRSLPEGLYRMEVELSNGERKSLSWWKK